MLGTKTTSLTTEAVGGRRWGVLAGQLSLGGEVGWEGVENCRPPPGRGGAVPVKEAGK